MSFCSTSNWFDLPHDIVILIINKLHFVDQVCALAVCKNWRDCKDRVRSPDTLIPWVLGHKLTTSRCEFFERISVYHNTTCELFNPYSQQVVHNVPCTKSIRSSRFREPLASKQGWSLFHTIDSSRLVFLMCNPFTNDTKVVVPKREEICDIDRIATINVDPVSRECELFMLGIYNEYLRIDAYKASGHTTESIVKISEFARLYRVLYMKGTIYCLMSCGYLYSYSLKDKSWKLLTSGHSKLRVAYGKCWLLEIKENLILLVAELKDEVCKSMMIFRFDWSEMSWVVETGLESCAIYISRHLAFSAPLRNRSGEKLQGCRVFFLGRGINCYAFSEGEVVEIHCEDQYSWIRDLGPYEWSFIEPPFLRI